MTPIPGKARRRTPGRVGKRARATITREEFDVLVDLLNRRFLALTEIQHEQDVQFQRIAQIQAELDLIRRACEQVRARKNSTVPD